MTNKSSAQPLRLPAEWEAQDAVMIAWPHELTDWNYMLDDVERCYIDLAKAISRFVHLIIIAPDVTRPQSLLADIDGSALTYIKVDTNDTWTRDYGAITCVEDSKSIIKDFKFNGWGLKFASNLDNQVTHKLHARGIYNGAYDNNQDFVLEGGSIESDGCGTILTTSECLLSFNRNATLTREQIAAELCRRLGAKRVLWLDHGALQGDDTDSHVDTLARLVAEDTIVYASCDDEADPHFLPLKAMEEQIRALKRADGVTYNTLALPLPDAIYDEDGQRLPATYANFLITNNAVLMPTYGQPRKDELAHRMLQVVFDDREIVDVDCRALIRQHGSLHCATMQFPAGSINLTALK